MILKRAFLLLFILVRFSVTVQAQKFSFNDVVDFTYKGFGPIINKNEVQGYYVLYENDKLNKDSSSYIIKILDQNLGEISNKEITAPVGNDIESILFNGKSLLIKQFQKEDKQANFQVMRMGIDGSIDKLSERSLKLHKKDSRSNVHALPDLGYLDIYGTHKKKAIVEYHGDDGTKWSYNTPDTVGWEFINYVAVDTNKVILSSYKKNKVTDAGDYFIYAFDIADGSMLYQKVLTFEGRDFEVDRGFVSPIKNEVWIVGDYFEKGDNEEIINSDGLFIMKMNPETGKILHSSYMPWEGKINRYSNAYKRGKLKKGWLHFHDFVFLKNGEVFGIAEQYRKQFRFMGLVERTVSVGTYGHHTKMIVGDLLLFQFNDFAELVKTRRGRKPEKDFLLGNGFFGGTLLIPGKRIGVMLDDINAYNYTHYSVNNENTDFDLFYFMKEDLTKRQQKQYKREPRWILRTIGYENRTYTTDKIYLTSESKNIAVFPAKPGHILMYEQSEDWNGLRLERIK